MGKITVLFSILALLALQSDAKAPAIPALVLHAQYVALGYETASGFVAETEFAPIPQPGVQPDDRQVLGNIHEALSRWKRYTVTIVPEEADLLIAVRTGRTASVGGGIHIDSGRIDPASGRRTGPGIGPAIGAEAGPDEDYLAVYQADKGREAARLWVRTEENGLLGRNPRLFQTFKDEVDSAAKKAQSKTP